MKNKINYVLLLVVSSGVLLLLLFLGLGTNLLKSADTIVVAVLLGVAINVVSQYLYNVAQDKARRMPKVLAPSLESELRKIRECEAIPSDILSLTRRQETVRLACDALPFVIDLRQNHLKALRKAFSKSLQKSRATVMGRAAWSSVSSTTSGTGYRFVMGFKNVGCAYWRNDPFHLGCFSCGYCSGIVPEVEPTQQELETQFENALGQALGSRVDFDVVEFLNDGSFFNDDEIAPSFRQYLFRKLNSLPYVKRVLVETRPQYVNRSSVLQVLSELAPDKGLEIGIGLESADEFIRAVCIRKGFRRSDFEEAVDCLASFGGRIGIVAYSLVKPPFLSEVEAIDDEIHTARYLSALSANKKCKITLKLEPCVVAKGTLVDFLYFHGNETINHKYSILSYWTVIEILCRLSREDVQLPVRVGAREDMDIIEKVPAVYDSNGMFNKWDFILYEAVQHFNVHGSVPHLLAEIEGALSDRSFEDWKLRMGGQMTAIEGCRKALADEIDRAKSQTDERSRRAFLMKVFSALDRVEYGEKGSQFARRLVRGCTRVSADKMRTDVQQFVEGQFREIMKDFWLQVCEVHVEADRPQLLRIYFQLRDLTKQDALYNVWAGIPSQRT
jgi:radical SAM enzyme (TIGR01210 family)